jgi:hypothetical protein
MKYAVILLALTMMAPVQAADPEFLKTMSCMRASVPPLLRADNFQIESTDRSGVTRLLEGKFFAKREKDRLKVMLHITSPTNVAGASYLVLEGSDTQEDDMYVFLPTVNRVRHVTGSFANGALLGTDFSYAEVKQISNAFTGADGKSEGTDQIDGRKVNVISLEPLRTLRSPYSSVRAWVDQQSCFVLKAEFYVGSTIRKRMTTPGVSIRQSGKYWYQSELQMQDLKLGTHTTMKLQGVDSTKEIPASTFSPTAFHIGR